MNSWSRGEKLQLYCLIVATVSLFAMFVVPNVGTVLRLDRPSVARTSTQPDAYTLASATSTDNRPVPPISLGSAANALEFAFKKLDARQGLKIQNKSGRARPAMTLESLTHRLQLESAILSFRSLHSREPNDAELDTLIDGVLTQRAS
jgi:hypothetical protein